MSNKDIIDLVESAASYAGALYNGLEKIVDDLREDNVRKGLNTFAQAIEGLDWIFNAINIISKTYDYDEFNIESAKSFLAEMTEASENMDYILLTDLIEYEILPIIDGWGIKLDEILEKQKTTDNNL